MGAIVHFTGDCGCGHLLPGAYLVAVSGVFRAVWGGKVETDTDFKVLVSNYQCAIIRLIGRLIIHYFTGDMPVRVEVLRPHAPELMRFAREYDVPFMIDLFGRLN